MLQCRYRHLARGAKNKSRELGKPVSGPQSIPGRPGSGRWSGDMGTKLDSSPYSSLGTSFERIGPGFPSGGQTYSSGGSGFGVTTNGYSEYSSLPTAGTLRVCVGFNYGMVSLPPSPSPFPSLYSSCSQHNTYCTAACCQATNQPNL